MCNVMNFHNLNVPVKSGPDDIPAPFIEAFLKAL